MAVLDASVQIALVNSADHHHEAALVWYQGAITGDEAILAPSIIVAEVAAGIRRGLDDQSLARLVVQDMLSGGLIQLVPVDADLAAHAADIAITHRIRGCDAVYVALAAALDESLVTFDEKQAERAAAAVAVLRPRIT